MRKSKLIFKMGFVIPGNSEIMYEILCAELVMQAQGN